MLAKTSFDKGIEKGIEIAKTSFDKGIEQGRLTERQELVLDQLETRFRALNEEERRRLTELPPERLKQLSRDLLNEKATLVTLGIEAVSTAGA